MSFTYKGWRKFWPVRAADRHQGLYWESSRKAPFHSLQYKMCSQWMCCKMYSYGCWYYGAVVLCKEDKCVLFWENACWHLSLRKWIRGFHNLFMVRPPLWFIFLGCSFICFASPVMEVFIIVFLFIYFYITWCQQWHNMPKIVTCWKYFYCHLSFLFHV